MSATIQYPNTPGVKVKEVSLLPPSVVQVASAIPVFLGYTQKGNPNEAVRITSLKEYTDVFGGPYPYVFGTTSSQPRVFNLFENMRAYFDNGGGACYVIPVGNWATNLVIDSQHFIDSLVIVETLDEPTLIVFPEAVALSLTDYSSVANEATKLAASMGDRMVLVDTPVDVTLTGNANDLTDFRSALSQYLDYAAAYYPHVQVNYSWQIDETQSTYDGTLLSVLKSSGNADYATAIAGYRAEQVILPPSAIVAGIYAKTDRENGVWKAPANVALQSVIRPVVTISDSTQESLNVDANTGKSINAIRSFTGKGTLVWGARTLAGNSNEWRYINVRRLFLTVEESVKKAISQFVFENNDAKTWVKVNAMIGSYLNGVWKEGGLVGAKAEEAYFVQTGLGVTMTQQDILDGNMIVRIGLAAVRPAEFIVLEFSHFIR